MENITIGISRKIPSSTAVRFSLQSFLRLFLNLQNVSNILLLHEMISGNSPGKQFHYNFIPLVHGVH